MGKYLDTATSLSEIMIGTTFDTATTALAVRQVTWAEAEVDKYLSKRYDLSAWNTLTSVPPIVRSLTEDLSAGKTYIYNSRGGTKQREHGESLIEMALDNLKQIADGELGIADTTGAIIPEDTGSNSSTQVLCNTTDYATTFDEGDPLNWRVDDDKLSDISDSKD